MATVTMHVKQPQNRDLQAVMGILFLLLSSFAGSQELSDKAEEDPLTELRLMADSATTTESNTGADMEVKPGAYMVEEFVVGNRLDRITVYRTNRFTEVYENTGGNSMWLNEEEELGETPNIRRWIIGRW